MKASTVGWGFTSVNEKDLLSIINGYVPNVYVTPGATLTFEISCVAGYVKRIRYPVLDLSGWQVSAFFLCMKYTSWCAKIRKNSFSSCDKAIDMCQ